MLMIQRTIRRAAAIACGFVLGACPVAGPANAGTAQLAACRMSRLTLTTGPWVSEETGQHTLALRLVNQAASACFLYGYPKITLRDRTGVVPFVIRHGGDQMITSKRPTRVVVRPGRSAFVLLNNYRCDRGGRRAATTVRIGLPYGSAGQAASIRLTDRYRRPNYCGPGDPGSTLTVSPFAPTLRAALRS